MFGKNKKSTETMDEALPFMGASDAAELRARVGRAFAASGHPVEVFADHVATANGQQYGLWNLATYCDDAERGRKDWDAIIARHVHTLLNPPPEIASLTDEQLREIVHSRLFSADSFPEGPNDPRAWGREIAEGVIELLVADFPDSIQSLSEDDVTARVGDAIWARGRANTLATPVEATGQLQAEGGATITVAMGESFFLASRVVDLAPLLVDVYGERKYPRGVVVGIPHRHQIVLHPLDDARSIAAIGVAAQFTAAGYSDSPGGISPLLYWWDGAKFHTVSKFEEDGSVGILAAGSFLEAVNTLAGGGATD